MGPFGVIISHLEPFGGFWRHFKPFHAIFKHFEPFGEIWSILELYGQICSALKIFGKIWSDLELFGTCQRELVAFPELLVGATLRQCLKGSSFFRMTSIACLIKKKCNCAISERLYAGLGYTGFLKISLPDFGGAERADQGSGRSQKYPPPPRKKS